MKTLHIDKCWLACHNMYSQNRAGDGRFPHCVAHSCIQIKHETCISFTTDRLSLLFHHLCWGVVSAVGDNNMQKLWIPALTFSRKIHRKYPYMKYRRLSVIMLLQDILVKWPNVTKITGKQQLSLSLPYFLPPYMLLSFGLFVQSSSRRSQVMLSDSNRIKAAVHMRAANGREIKVANIHTCMRVQSTHCVHHAEELTGAHKCAAT